MRILLAVGFAISSLICRMGHAETRTNDEVFANAALRDIHELAMATAQWGEATKDSDNLGCQYANETIEKASHKALENMHYMSLTPSDAIRSVSTLLRLNHIEPRDSCPSNLDINLQWLTAGQAVMALRWDYAIGNIDWYLVEANGDVRGENPLLYTQSLWEQNYSWISLRPKGMRLLVVPDWKSEMASYQIDDPSIENSGNDLQAVEVAFRKNSGDENSEVYFHRTKEGAIAVAQEVKKQAEDAAKQQVADAEWTHKLTSLQYVTPNHDIGFKLIYAVCRPSKNGRSENVCNIDDSHDWSDDRKIPYRWFSDIQECESAQFSIGAKHPVDVPSNPDDTFMSDCVPAPKTSGHILKGYTVIIAMAAQDASPSRGSFANLRAGASDDALLFKAFSACYANISPLYPKIAKDLGVDENGQSLTDKSKSIALIANCVRMY